MRNRKEFWAGFACGIFMVFLVVFLILASGALDLSASSKSGAIERTFALWAFERSMVRRSPKAHNPFANDASARAVGMSHYRDDCMICHGGAGIAGKDFSMGLNPPAPALEGKGIQSLSDGELFWIVKNGIRWSGMPAFDQTHNDTDIWKITSFVRHLSHLTPEENDQLTRNMEHLRNHSAAQADQHAAEPGVKADREH